LRYSKHLTQGSTHVQVSTDHRLMRWDGTAREAVEITAGMPDAQNHTISAHAGELIVINSAGKAGGKVSAVCVNIQDGRRRDFTLESSHAFPRQSKVLNGAVLLGYSDKVEACSMEDGRRIHSLEISKQTKFDAIAFDGQRLSIRRTFEDTAQPLSETIVHSDLPTILPRPTYCGFDDAGALVLGTEGEKWALSLPDLRLVPTKKPQLFNIQIFREVPSEREAPLPGTPRLSLAEWHADCRLIYDSRGILHMIFKDRHGIMELAVLCLQHETTSAWVRSLTEQRMGAAQWFTAKSTTAPSAVNFVPFMMRFAAVARALSTQRIEHNIVTR
jgi:hypothetical protein